MYSQEKFLGGGLFSLKLQARVIVCSLIKKVLQRKGFAACNLYGSSFQNIRKLSARYLSQTFFNKVVGLQSIGYNSIENNVFDKNSKS